MADYIVRIYRKRFERPPGLDGLLEEVDGRARHPFHTAEELCALLRDLELELDPSTRPGPE